MRIGPALGIPGDTASAGGQFRPTQLTGLQLWLRGDLGFTAATGVWVDQSGNGNTTTPQSATRPSASTLNGKPSVLYPGAANQALVTPSITLGTFTILVAFSAPAACYVFVHNTDAGTDGAYLYTDTTTTNGYYKGSVVSDKAFAAGMKDGVTRTASWTADGTTAGNLLYFGQTVQTEVTNTGNDPGTGNTAGFIYLGASQAGGGVGALNLGEVIVYNRVLSASELAKLQVYAKNYWGT